MSDRKSYEYNFYNKINILIAKIISVLFLQLSTGARRDRREICIGRETDIWNQLK